jgi:hypothetical protein
VSGVFGRGFKLLIVLMVANNSAVKFVMTLQSPRIMHIHVQNDCIVENGALMILIFFLLWL